MKNIFILLFVCHVIVKSSHSYAIYEDGGQIDGYGPESVDRQLDPEEEEFERQQINRLPFEDEMRSKRAVKYKVMESPGLHSHFHVIQDLKKIDAIAA